MHGSSAETGAALPAFALVLVAAGLDLCLAAKPEDAGAWLLSFVAVLAVWTMLTAVGLDQRLTRMRPAAA